MERLWSKFLFIIVGLLLFSSNHKVLAFSPVEVADGSANLVLFNVHGSPEEDVRVLKLRCFLQRRSSPLSDYAEQFVSYADYYNLDWRLVAAISGVESNFGKKIPAHSYNAWGWNGGDYIFSSWTDGISHVSSVLKKKYHDRGLITVNQIGPVYAPPSSVWSGNVNFFMQEIYEVKLPVESQLAFAW